MFRSLFEGFFGVVRDLVAKDHPYIGAGLAALLAVMVFCVCILVVSYSPASVGVAVTAGGAIAAIFRGRR